MNQITSVEITVTTSTGEVGGFTLNFHEDLFVGEALRNIQTEITETFGEKIIMSWGSKNSPWGQPVQFTF